VSLTFEADNCAPGAHFAYAYVALRNTCAGLEISGNLKACTNSTATYSIPALAGATYSWTVPAGWTINSGSNTNIIHLTPGATGGKITVNEKNSCANLNDTITVEVMPPTVAGGVLGNTTVCSGTNSTQLSLNGSVGNVLGWLYSNNGTQWNAISNKGPSYTAQNLTATTQFKAIVQNGSSCKIDTSGGATISVDPQSIGGSLSPANTNICLGQTTTNTFTLTGTKGTVHNWQQSFDSTNWTNFSPAKTDLVHSTANITSNTYYRVLVKSGVCPADTSSVAAVQFFTTPFPNAAITPDSVVICYGKTASFNATIYTGTSYTWSPSTSLTNTGNGTTPSLPYTINAVAAPLTTTAYILTVKNAGCPNLFTDTFRVRVSPKITVFAGNDTAIVANQKLQLNAAVNDPAANQFTWTPPIGLNFTTVQNPVATLIPSMVEDAITYVVRATNPNGCYGEDNINVRVFKTGPDVFVPDAFTPNGDGHNDIIRPVLVGVKQLNFFRVYNRWGQLVFSTTQNSKGWDGRIAGQQQSSGNFVYVVQAVDYTGKLISKKGSIILIR
jgi:gliding motility-associated-like protein